MQVDVVVRALVEIPDNAVLLNYREGNPIRYRVDNKEYAFWLAVEKNDDGELTDILPDDLPNEGITILEYFENSSVQGIS